MHREDSLSGRTEFIITGDGPAEIQLADGVELREFASGQRGARGMFTGTANLRPKSVLPYHTHPCCEVMVVLKGAVAASVRGRQYLLGPFDALSIPKDVEHSVRCDSNEGIAVVHVSFPSGAPERNIVQANYADARVDVPPEGAPERLRRFRSAEVYSLAPHTSFRDLFASRFGSHRICGGYGRFEPGASLPCHTHNYDESITIVEGQAICQAGGRTYSLSHNDTPLGRYRGREGAGEDSRVSSRTGPREPAAFVMAETMHEMVVDHADGLHMGIHDGAAHKLESALLEVVTQRIRFRCCGGEIFQPAPSILNGPPVDKTPDIGIE